jgi:hypothetical protein
MINKGFSIIIALIAKFILTFAAVYRYIIHMSKKDKSAYIEDQDQINALEEFAPKIREILRDYRKKRQLSSIARQLGFHQSRLTEMITKNENGEYKKRVTPYYLAKFIDSGIMDARQILAGRNIDDLPVRARIFFKRMILPPKTLELVIEAQRRGINLDRILQEILYPNSND